MSTAATVDFETTINSQIEVFVSEYQSYARKSAMSVLVLAKTVLNARNTLKAVLESDYVKFREDPRVDLSDSAAKKLCVIAEAAERIDNLLVFRNAYVNASELATSALYEIARLTDAEYDAFVSSLSATTVITAASVVEFNEKAKAKAAEKAKKDAESNAVLPLVEDKQDEESTAEVPKADDKTVRQLDVDKVVSAANASILAVATSEASTYAKCDVTQVVVRIDDLSDEQKNKFMSRIKSVLDDFNLSTKAEFLSDFDVNAAFADLEAA